MNTEIREKYAYAYSNVRNRKGKDSSEGRIKSDEIRGKAEESGGRDTDAGNKDKQNLWRQVEMKKKKKRINRKKNLN